LGAVLAAATVLAPSSMEGARAALAAKIRIPTPTVTAKPVAIFSPTLKSLHTSLQDLRDGTDVGSGGGANDVTDGAIDGGGVDGGGTSTSGATPDGRTLPGGMLAASR
jgi:hypothetical protein